MSYKLLLSNNVKNITREEKLKNNKQGIQRNRIVNNQ